MSETIQLGDITIAVTRKCIKNVHLSVHPPEGHVTLSAPLNTRLDVARAYAISKLGWIRQQQIQLRNQERETPHEFIGRETHYLWGRRYLLSVEQTPFRPKIDIDHKRITLFVRADTDPAERARIMHDWHKSLLHDYIRQLLRKWEPKLGVKVQAYFLQRMKTKWGSCNHKDKNIRLNTELVKKPKDLVEYVVVHELVHLLEPTHNSRFITLLSEHFPNWREARAELNGLPLATEKWR